jgi:putative acetyltransferase
MIIREELANDIPGVRKVEEAAFGRKGEAELVDRLRQRNAATLSLVAIEGEDVVGHVLFSPGEVSNGTESWPCVGLGPVAVLPDHQRMGIGKKLIEAGLEKCWQAGVKAVFLLGDPAYYSRFGFKRTDRLGIRCEFEVPAEDFMVIAAEEGALTGWSGVMHYQPEFKDV